MYQWRMYRHPITNKNTIIIADMTIKLPFHKNLSMEPTPEIRSKMNINIDESSFCLTDIINTDYGFQR